MHIILGLLFGVLGLHNFYAGHNLRGAIKLGLLFFCFVLDASTRFYTGFTFVMAALIGIWCLVEVIVVNTDSTGRKMS